MVKLEATPIRILKEFHGEFCDIALRSDGILEVNTIANVEYGHNETQVVIQNILAISESKKYYILIVSGHFASVTFESLKLLSGPEAMSYAIAKAYVINSMPQKIMANFFVRMIHPKKPIRFFKNQEDAENWLKSLALPGNDLLFS